jgi:hypothetical protein
MTKMPLAEQDNVVKAFQSDRADQPFSISILPWGAATLVDRECRLIAVFG